MTQIVMPQLSDSMQEGTIVRWLIADGASVAVGEELFEVETDKATMAVQAEREGILAIAVAEGETVATGTVIATIGETAAPPPVPAAVPPAPAAVPPAPAAVPAPLATRNGNGSAAPAGAGVLLATPVARRLARAHGVSLEEIAGSGPRGRITKADVAQAAGVSVPVRQAPAPVAAHAGAATQAPPAPDADGTATIVEPTRLQQVIARRMVQAKATVPDFQVQTEVAMDGAIALRDQLKALLAPDGAPPSYNDLIVKACALALRSHARVNGSFLEGRFHLHQRVNIGIAVAAGEALVVPTVFDADIKSLGTIASESRRLAERVRSGLLTPPELSGGTFTVSNLGMYGMTAITPVINPPQAAILGVGTMRETLARVDGQIVDRTLMTLTLSCDHRILYGADGARFLRDVRSLLEEPMRILL